MGWGRGCEVGGYWHLHLSLSISRSRSTRQPATTTPKRAGRRTGRPCGKSSPPTSSTQSRPTAGERTFQRCPSAETLAPAPTLALAASLATTRALTSCPRQVFERPASSERVPSLREMLPPMLRESWSSTIASGHQKQTTLEVSREPNPNPSNNPGPHPHPHPHPNSNPHPHPNPRRGQTLTMAPTSTPTLYPQYGSNTNPGSESLTRTQVPSTSPYPNPR